MTTDLTKKDSFDIDIDMSDFMMILMMLVMASIIPAITSLTSATGGIGDFVVTAGYPPNVGLGALEKEGDVRPVTLNARQVLQYHDLIHTYPFTPWNSAYFINDGPFPVEIGINHPQERFIMNPGEAITVDSTRAQYKIAIIFYMCLPSQTASVRVTGGY